MKIKNLIRLIEQQELQDIVRKPENEGRKLHIFDYSQTLAQKPRPVTKVARV